MWSNDSFNFPLGWIKYIVIVVVIIVKLPVWCLLLKQRETSGFVFRECARLEESWCLDLELTVVNNKIHSNSTLLWLNIKMSLVTRLWILIIPVSQQHGDQGSHAFSDIEHVLHVPYRLPSLEKKRSLMISDLSCSYSMRPFHPTPPHHTPRPPKKSE